MNTDTGKVKQWKDITEEERKSGKWVEIPPELEEKVLALSEEARIQFMKEAESVRLEGKRVPRTDHDGQGINKKLRNKKRKLAKLARRRNRNG